MAEAPAEPRFGAVEVIQLASKLAADDIALVIGGQATKLWAWYCQDKDPALGKDDPITGRDVDDFGTVQAAESLEKTLDRRAIRPPLSDMNTPNTAKVIASFNGKELEIDFLDGVLGIRREELETGVSILQVAATSGSER